MIEAAEAVIGLVGDDTAQALAADPLRRAAAMWHFTVLGEASSQLPTDFKDSHPDIPWVDASRLRNRIVPGYWDISIGIVHAAALDDLPGMIEALTALLSSLEGARPSDGQIQAWADEAETGCDVEELRRSAHGPQEIEEQP